jgi:4-amino-4-deoxy-L-arabinose transferase-like glycosyltransferase
MSYTLDKARRGVENAARGAYDLAARAPLFVLSLLFGLQTLPHLQSRALWFSDEIRYADAFTHLVRDHKWLVLYLNGQFYPDKPPVYFWFLALLRWLTNLDGPPLFYLGAALSGLFFLWASYALARIVFAASRELAFGAGLVLLGTFYFMGLSHYSRMDLLFGSLIIMTHVCLFQAWREEQSTRWLSLGLGLAALATLVKGPLGLAFPVATSLLFLFWTRNLRRLRRRDVAIGAGVCLGVLVTWLAAVLLTEDTAYLQNVFHEQIYRRAVNTWHHEQPFYHYLLTLPAAWAPWTLALAALDWGHLLQPSFWNAFWLSREAKEGETSGRVFVWCMLLSGFTLLSVLSIKIVVYLIPLFGPLAILTADGLSRLDERRCQRFGLCVAGLWALFGLVLPFVNLMHPWPIAIRGLIPASLLALAAAWFFWKLAPRRAPLLFVLSMVLVASVWIQPAALVTAPSLDRAMSPKNQAYDLAAYANQGYYALVYKVYPGTYTYYAGRNLHETADLAEVERIVASKPKVVLAMRKKHWEQWPNRPASLTQVHEQWIADQPYVLVIKADAG